MNRQKLWVVEWNDGSGWRPMYRVFSSRESARDLARDWRSVTKTRVVLYLPHGVPIRLFP